MSDGTGRIYQRGDIWWIDYSFRGKRHRESSGSTKKGVAVKLLRKRMAEMGRGRLIGPDAEKLAFEDMATMIEDDYRVQRRSSTNSSSRHSSVCGASSATTVRSTSRPIA